MHALPFHVESYSFFVEDLQSFIFIPFHLRFPLVLILLPSESHPWSSIHYYFSENKNKFLHLSLQENNLPIANLIITLHILGFLQLWFTGHCGCEWWVNDWNTPEDKLLWFEIYILSVSRNMCSYVKEDLYGTLLRSHTCIWGHGRVRLLMEQSEEVSELYMSWISPSWRHETKTLSHVYSLPTALFPVQQWKFTSLQSKEGYLRELPVLDIGSKLLPPWKKKSYRFECHHVSQPI